VGEYADKVAVLPVRLGPNGIAKQIFVGVRETDTGIDYLRAFIALAKRSGAA
jgi:LysR family transcriptional regulator for metE and metH